MSDVEHQLNDLSFSISQPLSVVQYFFERLVQEKGFNEQLLLGDWGVPKYFENLLNDEKNYYQVPSLNEIPIEHIQPNSLVRFRCMIQDIFDPEYYVGLYYEFNETTGNKALRSGKYYDILTTTTGTAPKFDEAETKTFDRTPLYCVPIPAETQWAKDIYRRMAPYYHETQQKHGTDSQNDNRMTSLKKRQREESDISESNSQIGTCEKRTKNEKCEENTLQTPTTFDMIDMNFPVPDTVGPAALVKIYGDHEDCLKLNDLIEVIGIFSLTPSLAFEEFNDMFESKEEALVHSPPSSLVPRIHCLTYRKLNFYNPLLPLSSVKISEALISLRSQVPQLRECLIDTIASSVFNDRLAANYILANLLSRVYARSGLFAVGNFPLNVISSENDVSTQLTAVIRSLVPLCHYLPLTIESLCNGVFVPTKDYDLNRLRSGQLQLANGTHLVIDETKLQPGTLNQHGLTHLRVLNDFVMWQKVEYDFKYHEYTVYTDIPTIIISTSRSIFAKDGGVCVLVPLQPNERNTADRVCNIVTNDELLKALRSFLGLLRTIDFKPTDESLTQFIQNDIVELRKQDPRITFDLFHTWLTLARLTAISFGEESLTQKRWETTKNMEMIRLKRLETLLPKKQNNMKFIN
jgi:hypothetical protein